MFLALATDSTRILNDGPTVSSVLWGDKQNGHVTYQWPSKQETLTRYCFDAGPASSTSDQHQNNIGSVPRACWGGILPFRIDHVSVWAVEGPIRKQDWKSDTSKLSNNLSFGPIKPTFVMFIWITCSLSRMVFFQFCKSLIWRFWTVCVSHP